MSVDSRLKRADDGITQGMTNRLNKLIRDTEDIRRKTLESALADMPLDFEEQDRPNSSMPSQSNPDPERPKRQLRRSDVSDEGPRKKARLPSRVADVNRPVRRYIVEARYTESWIFSYVTNGVQEHFILRCPVSGCPDRSFSQNPIESGCGINHLRDHGIKVADEDDLVHKYARRMIIRDESETGSISKSWVEEHNKAIGEPYDTADGEDCDSKSDVDEDIDELGQDAIPSPRALGSTKSEFEKTGIAEISVVEYGDLGN
ncbi:hypothetical protein CCHR01_19032 [Colletotrichum chrysophilum]|uniref:Uncharacterized protein n=1 Tax=Colletotrichum chrysophilum TaxID=1836956 RepID=A0AAD9A1A8_9PEZI|nr:hypothetical protein CGCFRS4_v013627 [Colletotrichum fructicola]KAK1838342.1 hypothetical protein CCHR01_19032 [Colletotrichum chrysophilum]